MDRFKLNRLSLTLCLLIALFPNVTAQEKTLPEPPSNARPLFAPPSPIPQPGEQPATVDDIQSPSFEEPVFINRGVLVETMDGQIVMEQAKDQAYNPASTIKLATALAALRTFGPQHRFATAVWTNGTFDQTTGTITGDLIISGRDPSFHYKHAIMLARELNRLGIRTVTGDLIVASRFTMNFSPSALRSGERLYDTLDVTRRPEAATRAWYEDRQAFGDTASLQSVPSVAVMGAVYVDSVPPKARVLLTHYSSTLVDVLKVLLCYSNNFMADRLGDSLGGPQGVQRFLINEIGLSATDLHLATTSGLGVNRMTPRAMMKVYRALLAELAKNRLSPSDIMPVAGIDPGTLQKRYTFASSRGSVIAKTGTLGRTSGGASSLVGQLHTQSGETLLFVIFCQRGSVWRFRQEQDTLVTQLQYTRGGPAPFAYTPHTLAMRLSNTEVDPAKPASTDEFESISN